MNLFWLTLISMFLALWANFSEFAVSSIFTILQDTFTIMCVRDCYNESCNNLVIFDSLNGIGNFYEFFELWDKLYITLPNVVKLWLILLNSCICALSILSILLIFSDPAKSHRFIFALNSAPPISALLLSMIN